MAGQPFSKEQQLARGERRYGRKVAGAKRWQQIIDAKAGPCRICGKESPIEFHHLVARAIGGSDTEANIVPLCSDCHRLVTNNDLEARMALRANLDLGKKPWLMRGDEESYAREKLGDARFEMRYPAREVE